MRHLCCIVLGFVIFYTSNAQIVTLSSGVSYTKLNWTINESSQSIYPDAFVSPVFHFGTDVECGKFVIYSGNVGRVRMGGKASHQVFSPARGVLSENTGGVDKAYLDYLTLNSSLYLKYNLTPRLLPFVGIGVQFEYLLNETDQFQYFSARDGLANTNFGLLFTGGIKYIFPNHLVLGFRADKYLFIEQIAKSVPSSFTQEMEVKVNVLTCQLICGYMFK